MIQNKGQYSKRITVTSGKNAIPAQEEVHTKKAVSGINATEIPEVKQHKTVAGDGIYPEWKATGEEHNKMAEDKATDVFNASEHNDLSGRTTDGTLNATHPFTSIGTIATNEWYVDNRTDSYTADGSIARPYKTIQAAINASAANDIIYILTGDFTENLSITKNLILKFNSSCNLTGNITSSANLSIIGITNEKNLASYCVLTNSVLNITSNLYLENILLTGTNCRIVSSTGSCELNNCRINNSVSSVNALISVNLNLYITNSYIYQIGNNASRLILCTGLKAIDSNLINITDALDAMIDVGGDIAYLSNVCFLGKTSASVLLKLFVATALNQNIINSCIFTTGKIDFNSSYTTIMNWFYDNTADNLNTSNVSYVEEKIRGKNIFVDCNRTDKYIPNGTQTHPYRSITEANTHITDNSTVNRYNVIVAAGNYVETNPLVLKDYCNYSAEGGEGTTVIMPSDVNQNVISLGISSFFEKFSIVGGNQYAIDLNHISYSGINNITLIECKKGIQVQQGLCLIRNLNVLNLSVTQDETIYYFNAGIVTINTIAVLQASKINILIKGDGATSFAYIRGISCSSNQVIKCTSLNNLAVLYIGVSNFRNAQNVFYIENTGGYIYANACSVQNTLTYDIYLPNALAYYEGESVTLRKDKFYIGTGATFLNSGFDFYDNSYKIVGDSCIGILARPSDFCVGEGNSCNLALSIIDYNADTGIFTDITNTANKTFPALSVNSAIYFGHLFYKFYAIKYLLNTQINKGAGGIIWEYWDAGVGNWLAINIFEHLEKYSNSNKNNTFSGTIGKNYSINFDNEIDTGIKESNAGATGWGTTTIGGLYTAYYVRCRIITNPITTAPILNNLFIKGSNFLVRNDGTREYTGKGRTLKRLLLYIGDGGATTGNANVNISPNINFGFQKNSFVNGATDNLFFRNLITNDFDTSSGIRFIIEAHTTKAYNVIAVNTANLTLYSAKTTELSVFAGGNPEVSQAVQFTLVPGDIAYQNKKIIVTNRINIADNTTGDKVWFKLNRLNTDNAFGANVILSNAYIEYTVWQDGAVYE